MADASPNPARRRLASGIAAGALQALAADAPGAFKLLAALEARGARPVVIIGDSHSRLYVHRDRRGREWLLPLHHLATGASARGLGRTASRSGVGETVQRLLAGLSAAGAKLPVLLVFGQVDVEFVFTFKRLEQEPPADHDAQTFDAFCRDTADAYAAFAAGLPMAPNISLAAIFPPALSDEAWRDGYLNAHIAHQHTALHLVALRERLSRARAEDLAARTAQHRAFNHRLQAAADDRRLGWLHAFDDLLDDGGVAGPERLGAAAGRDHHLDAEAVRPVISNRLWTMIERTSAKPAADV
jgi:hypothetical protein